MIVLENILLFVRIKRDREIRKWENLIFGILEDHELYMEIILHIGRHVQCTVRSWNLCFENEDSGWRTRVLCPQETSATGIADR